MLTRSYRIDRRNMLVHKHSLPMKKYWTIYFLSMAVFFTFILINTCLSQDAREAWLALIPLVILCIALYVLAIRWWRAGIEIGPQSVSMIKLFYAKTVPLASVNNFDFVTGRFDVFVYVGAKHESEVLLRSSYGPIQNIISVRRSARMVSYIAELNRALDEAKGIFEK